MELSTLGMGSYLGEADPSVDASYTESALAFFKAGGNVFDTAANYRLGRSEWALGAAFRQLPREAIFVSTKAGYLPLSDGVTQEEPRAWFYRELAAPGILSTKDIIDGCHAMTPRYLEYQLNASRRALGIECIDLFHLHNPEQQRPHLGPANFRDAIHHAFEACERFVQAGKISSYGCATWNGFRVPPEAPEHLSLEELLSIAQDVGGKNHHFQWVQLPLNLAMPEAFLAKTQRFHGESLTLLEATQRAGIQVQTSASMMQSRILQHLPPKWRSALGGDTAAQSALQFPRSCPGVAVALCGMSTWDHVVENSAILALPKADACTLEVLFA